MFLRGSDEAEGRPPVAADRSGTNAPVALQQAFWNSWNGVYLEHHRGAVSRRQASVVVAWLEGLGRRGLDILDVGCGSGWMCAQLAAFGQVTGTDLSDEVLRQAQQKLPQVRFIAGDFMTLPLPEKSADVVVILEVLAHVADQRAFLARIAKRLRCGGRLMLATQNRFVLERSSDVAPRAEGQIRQWVGVRELRRLLETEFIVDELFTVHPHGHGGVLRAVNSPRLNGWLARCLGQSKLDRWKEQAGLGHTAMALARVRSTTP